ncbi:MAG: hypothetical protein GY903_21760 [Fuerstiella sp.]|nr:hypothetical protein [Fuerstiella sp.]MCP4857118.1 hypothetical protein [Fuerstiella sp.]
MSPSESRRDQTELEKVLRSTKPWFAENGTTLIYALAAVLAVAAVIVFMQRQSSGDVQASGALLLAAAPEQYRDVADDFPETSIGIWARLRQGDRLLDNAVGNMFTNRVVAIEEGGELDQAEVAYQRLAERSDVDEQVRERVLIGLARVAETRCDGQPESTNTAVTAWQRVLDEFPESIVKKHAEERLAELSSEESRTFYTWFHEQNPTPVDPGLAPGQPEVPEIPSFDNLMRPAGEGSPGSDPATAGDDDVTEPEAASEAHTPEKPEASEEPPKPHADDNTETQTDNAATPGDREEPAAEGAAVPDAPTATNDGAGEEPAESTSPETPTKDSQPAAEGGDGNK